MTTTADAGFTAEGDYISSVTFLNMSGDITISWDEHNREHIVAMVKQKMKEGYSFFTTKKLPMIDVYRKVKVTAKNIDSLSEILIPDAEFEKMVSGMDDRDIVDLIHNDKAHLVKRASSSGKSKRREMTAVKRITNAEEILDNQSIGIRPVMGG